MIALFMDQQKWLDMETLGSSFDHAYKELAEGRTVICAKTSQEFAPLPAPDSAIIDV